MTARVEFRTEVVTRRGQPHERLTALLADGATVTFVEYQPFGNRAFAYRDARVSFEFGASRQSEEAEMLDTWSVFLPIGHAHIGLPDQFHASAEELAQITANIAAALFLWPPGGVVDARVPIKRVRFDTQGWPYWNPLKGPYLDFE